MISDQPIQTEIEIYASREKVWEVLTDFENMSQWSPGIQKLVGDFREGGQVTVHIYVMGRLQEFPHVINNLVVGESFGWSDPIGMGVWDNHQFRLQSLPNGRTLFRQTDYFTGTFQSLFRLFNFYTRQTFVDFNEALKKEVERRV